MLAAVVPSAPAEGRSSPLTRAKGPLADIARYDKTKAQCRGRRRCLRDYRQRRRCHRKPVGSVARTKCYVAYAARYYGQNPNDARATVSCESTYNRRARNGPYLGPWQFDIDTWKGAPHSLKIVRRVNGSVVRNRQGRAITKRRSRTNVKYTSLGAMWYWRNGERSRWPVCG